MRSTAVVESGWELIDGRPFLPDRRRVAVLAPYVPYPLAHDDAARMFHLLRETAREFDVVLFAFTEGRAQVEPLLEFCSRIALLPRPQFDRPRWPTITPPEAAAWRSRTMQTLWDGYTRELHVQVRQVESTDLAEYGGDILVTHDSNPGLHAPLAPRERNAGALWNRWRRRLWESSTFRRYARVVVVSGRDAAAAGAGNVRVVPDGVDTAWFSPEPEPEGEHLLFAGSFRHVSNALAWRFFTSEVWPLLRARFPQMTATALAGAEPELHWRLATGTPAPPRGDGLEVRGDVPDVRPFYAAANIAIVPPPVSGSTHRSTLEAMAAGRAIVATPAGSKVLGLRHGVDAWIAADARGFAEGIATLAADPALRARLATAARRRAEEHFDWKSIGTLQRAVIRSILERPVLVRAAHEDDVPELDRIQRAAPEAILWDPSSYLTYDCCVAEVDGRVAGFLVSRTLGADEAEILSLVVDPAMRRRGLAQRLMREVLSGHSGTWYLEVRESNSAARKLYRKLGFEEISLRPDYYQDTGETAVVMRLKPC